MSENTEETKLQKLERIMNGKAQAYQFIGNHDRHLINLFHWVDMLDKLFEEIRESEMDIELEKEIQNINLRLKREIGERITLLFP